jgi:HAE1 family hydrophobic/amphiphilic exporter-1
MWLTRVFLLRPTLGFVFIALTCIAGIMALRNLVVQEQPNTGLPTVSISVGYSGASTTDLQTEIAQPIEDQLAGTPYLQNIQTTIQSGSVSISASFSLASTDTENIANVEKALQAAQRQLPTTVTPTLRVADPSQPVVVTIALVSKKYSAATLGALANNEIVPAIEQLPGISNVNVTGVTTPAFMVDVDPGLLAASNLTVTDVVNAITPNNSRPPGGYVYQPGRETELDVRGDLPDPQSVANLPIHVAYTGTSGGATSGAASSAGFATGTTVPGAALGPDALSGPDATPPAAAGSPAPKAASSPSAGAFAQTSSAASTGVAAAGSTVGSTGTSASANVPVDTPIAPQTSTSTTATSSGTASSSAQPTVSSSAVGSGAGTSSTSFVGSLENWAVPSADKRVGDVATVLDSTVVSRISSSQNGRPGVTLLVQKQATSSEVAVSNEVIAALPALRHQFPGIEFQLAHVQSTFTEQQVESVEHTLVEGIILTAVVMLFFLGSWRNAVVVMIAIPTSLGVTLFVMYALGLTLDTISLMAMTLVIGILIDDSTVVLENIERHHAEGEAAPDAALNGRSEIGLAAIVITMVDVVVFLPIAFAGGQVGQNLHEFAIVITVATLTSLFVSFTITPMLAGLWSMNSTWRPWAPIRWFDTRFNRLRDSYAKRWLPAAIGRPWPILIVAILLVGAAYALVPTGLVGEEYIPAEDQGIIYAQVAFPAGHPLAQTEQAMSRLEKATKSVISAHDLGYEVTIAGAYSAAFGGFVQEGNVGQITVYLNSNRTRSTNADIDDLRSRFERIEPGAGITVTGATQQGGGNQQQIDELVGTTSGVDPTPYAAKVFATLKGTPGATGVQNSASNAAPQMDVQFNRPALQALDVTTGTAAQAVEAAFGGDIATQIETPVKGLTDIEVIYPQRAQTSLDDVLALPVRAQNGGIVHLGDVAYFQYQPAPLVITRQNREQVVHITANVAPGYELSNVVSAFQSRLRALHLPTTITLRPAALGQQDLLGQALVSLLASLAISIVLVFLMIVALYNSYRTPFVTLFAIPLATIGALGALWITHSTLNLYSLIGIVLLVGLVTKNGILLVDYADTRRELGASREDGIREAAATRFRPIIMTTLAMVAGMLPLALGLEPGAQSRASLAIVVIGGLLSSLALTLFIVPIMYLWIAPKELREPVKFGRQRATPDPA